MSVSVIGALFASFVIGPADIPVADLFAQLLEGGDTPEALIAREIRLPRALLGALVGGVLGLAGAALQGFLRNPLAEPGIVGASAGAAFGAVVAIYFGLAAVFPLALPLLGMAGALMVVA
ncbi:MAG TPA: iron ABC transporter permease, partial [Sneathiellales bacterium]|nr:iron ABC transporter permease [Sneathiellales bacterium]